MKKTKEEEKTSINMLPKEKPSYQIHNVEQGTEEWFDLRIQYPLTASEAQSIGSQGKGLETLVWKKLSEKYSTNTDEKYSNKDLERGKELEPIARQMYELETGNNVKEIGFVTNSKISSVGGASPDGGIVGQNGGLEIKCFEDKKHFQNIIDGLEIETKYEWQMQLQMLFMDWDFVDFVAYNPNFTRSLLVKRVFKDTLKQQKIITGLKMGEQLLKEIEDKYKKL